MLELLSPYNLLVIHVIQSIIDCSSQSFRLVWLFYCFHLGTPYQLIVLFSLMYLPMQGLVWSICSHWMFPVPEDFLSIFSINFPRSQFVVYHFVSLGSRPFSVAHFTANTFKVLLCRLTYSVPASFLHPDKRGCTVSLCSPHNLYLSHSTNPLFFPCSCFYHLLL